MPRLFQSPSLVLDALRRLSYAAQDRKNDVLSQRRADGTSHILWVASSLFIHSHQKHRRTSEQSGPTEDAPARYSLLPIIYIKRMPHVFAFDAVAARDYALDSLDPVQLCKRNADISRACDRVDHHRAFKLLEIVVLNASEQSPRAGNLRSVSLTQRLVEKLYVFIHYMEFNTYVFIDTTSCWLSGMCKCLP